MNIGLDFGQKHLYKNSSATVEWGFSISVRMITAPFVDVLRIVEWTRPYLPYFPIGCCLCCQSSKT